jgi:hypothetical protein
VATLSLSQLDNLGCLLIVLPLLVDSSFVGVVLAVELRLLVLLLLELEFEGG